jgi:hypothetical protein
VPIFRRLKSRISELDSTSKSELYVLADTSYGRYAYPFFRTRIMDSNFAASYLTSLFRTWTQNNIGPTLPTKLLRGRGSCPACQFRCRSALWTRLYDIVREFHILPDLFQLPRLGRPASR